MLSIADEGLLDLDCLLSNRTITTGYERQERFRVKFRKKGGL